MKIPPTWSLDLGILGELEVDWWWPADRSPATLRWDHSPARDHNILHVCLWRLEIYWRKDIPALPRRGDYRPNLNRHGRLVMSAYRSIGWR